ncbi:TetR/AcrR family transcriptional regulator [Actinoplanes sp. KI2]|uniref:TetR/AcrR family transcriptional regulator n=1 Tax=Actinoplanes sp. KI2 TaxID=2983315 RepID=UPI0021D5802A|nr:TetR/AcrR family transcriptional regulator [Actinoplanes sp. KI2]MCU7727928.1 TetR/AcrR family transcriptional regulator [Actinoplanes sp. KI2]
MQLRRADILRAARELIDAEGLDEFAPRKLAAALKVPAGDLQWYFADRPAVLEALADDLMAGVGDPPPAGPWDQRLITLAHRLRRALLGLRDGARLFSSTSVAEPNTVLAGRTGMLILIEAGLPPDRAAWTVMALTQFIVGHVIEEQSTRPKPAAGPAGEDELIGELAATVTADPARRFEFGLGLMLDGIRRLF